MEKLDVVFEEASQMLDHFLDGLGNQRTDQPANHAERDHVNHLLDSLITAQIGLFNVSPLLENLLVFLRISACY